MIYEWNEIHIVLALLRFMYPIIELAPALYIE